MNFCRAGDKMDMSEQIVTLFASCLFLVTVMQSEILTPNEQNGTTHAKPTIQSISYTIKDPLSQDKTLCCHTDSFPLPTALFLSVNCGQVIGDDIKMAQSVCSHTVNINNTTEILCHVENKKGIDFERVLVNNEGADVRFSPILKNPQTGEDGLKEEFLVCHDRIRKLVLISVGVVLIMKNFNDFMKVGTRIEIIEEINPDHSKSLHQVNETFATKTSNISEFLQNDFPIEEIQVVFMFVNISEDAVNLSCLNVVPSSVIVEFSTADSNMIHENNDGQNSSFSRIEIIAGIVVSVTCTLFGIALIAVIRILRNKMRQSTESNDVVVVDGLNEPVDNVIYYSVNNVQRNEEGHPHPRAAVSGGNAAEIPETNAVTLQYVEVDFINAAQRSMNPPNIRGAENRTEYAEIAFRE